LKIHFRSALCIGCTERDRKGYIKSRRIGYITFAPVTYATTNNSTQFTPAEGRNVQFTASLHI